MAAKLDNFGRIEPTRNFVAQDEIWIVTMRGDGALRMPSSSSGLTMADDIIEDVGLERTRFSEGMTVKNNDKVTAKKLNCREDICKEMEQKRHINAEVDAAKRWPKAWGFLTDSPQEPLKDESGEKAPGDCHETPATAASSTGQQADAAPAGLPRTSQGVIGWRVGGPGPPIDRYGPRARGKHDLCKMLKWPPEGFD